VTTDLCIVAGEITSRIRVDYEKVARRVIREVGYTHADIGFDADTCRVEVFVHAQSPDIARGVDEKGAEGAIGAGDQGLMFGYACDETEVLMPAPAWYARLLVRRLVELRTTNRLPWLRPDGKTQVTVEYRDGRPARVHTVVVSTQHSPEVDQRTIRREVVAKVVRPSIPEGMLDADTVYHVNPTGRFVVGGPNGDTGLTGRKIIVDTYGGMGRHGGGAFSGKDPTKVDRSAACAARWVAKNVVAAGLARRCELQLAYAIGVAEPVSIRVDAFGTGKVPEAKIAAAVRETFNLTPRGMIEALDLRRPIYRGLARDGHFGVTGGGRTWEETNRVDELRRIASPGGRRRATVGRRSSR